ncbi:MAG: hypothetical protein FJ284_09685 [Planctomycetes bacterium]|nr:hypothetical protein [Planctomycetota bacterium]MBM4058659.1 hypothetical protein [Planctomycetota bacterium]
MNISGFPMLMAAIVAAVASTLPAAAEAQLVYYPAYRPIVAAPIVAVPAYVANYTPAGNYAAVTAYSPPMVAAPGAVAVTSAYAPAVSPVAVTSFYAPTVVNYAPAPTVAFSPVVAAPMPAPYMPAAVAAPVVYRRGLFGVWRPVQTAYIPY